MNSRKTSGQSFYSSALNSRSSSCNRVGRLTAPIPHTWEDMSQLWASYTRNWDQY